MREVVIELRRLVALSVPIVATQLGNMSLGVVDVLMLGRVGREALDAAALGNLWSMGVLVLGTGVVLGLDPLVAQAHGAGDGRRLGLLLQRGLLVALLVSVPVMALWLATGSALELLGQAPHLAAEAQRYVMVQLPGAPAILIYAALRAYLQGRGIAGPALAVVAAANLINVAADAWLIFGGLGVPPLGATGAGLATGIVRVFMLAAMAWLIVRRGLHVGAWVPWSRAALDRRELALIVGMGLGVGLQIGLEVWAFQVTMLFAGWLGEAPLAAYSVVMNLASAAFMVPLGIGMAAAVRVGNLIGAGRHREARRAAFVALAFGATVMGASAIAFVLGREALPGLFGVDPVVHAIAAGMLPVAAAFQVFDGTQAVAGGIMRGMGRTRPAALLNLLGFWVLALPLAYWLAFRGGLGARGLWWGMTAGLFVVAVGLVAWIVTRGPGAAVRRR